MTRSDRAQAARADAWIQIALLAAILLLAVAWLPHTASEDIPYWLKWMEVDLQKGIVHGYHELPLEYPPLSRFILAVPARFARATGVAPGLALKASFLIAMLATGALFFWSTRDRWVTLGLLTALLLNNLGIGYLDAYVAPFFVLTLHFLWKERWRTAFVLLVISAFIKWQPGILGPFAVAYIAGRLYRADQRRWIVPAATTLVLPAIVIPGIIYAAFGPVLIGAFRYAANNIFVSGNALNLNWIYTVLLHVLDPGRFGALGAGEVLILNAPARFVIAPKLVFWGIYLFFLVRCAIRADHFKDFLAYATAGYFTYFMFNTAVHENHLAMLIVPLAFLAHIERPWKPVAAAIAVFVNLNMAVFYGFDGREQQFPKSAAGAWLLAAASLIGFALYLWTMRRVLRARSAP